MALDRVVRLPRRQSYSPEHLRASPNMRKLKAVSLIPHSYWVEPKRFLAGEHPGSTNQQYARDTVDALLRAGIRTFIDRLTRGA